jgi:hypothetical protein
VPAAEEYTADDLRREAWRRPSLRYLLHDGQCQLQDAWRKAPGRRFVICCSRRYGKSYWLHVEGVEACLSQPGLQVRYACPTAKMAKTISEPHMRTVLHDCPASLRPQFHRQDGVWRFPNGSELHVVGCDNGGHERLRGASTHLALVDEAGFIDELDYVVQDILLPQTITTDGRILIVSSPARTPAHAFTAYFSAALTPIPYKVFTIAGGVFNVSLATLIFASVLGRGLRFMGLSGLVFLLGDRVKPIIERYFEWITIGVCVLIALFFVVLRVL